MVQKMYRRRLVEEITGKKRSQLYKEVQEGAFPKPVKIGPRSVAWLESDIAKWQAERIEERDRAMASA
jgi:prophage regulatory protein